MKFTEAGGTAGLTIRAYEQGCIRVGDLDYKRSLIVTPERVLPDWPPQSIKAIRAEHLKPILALDPEIVVLGTGPAQAFPDPELSASVLGQRVGLEIMDTGAACRTYNILMSEGRRVVAALIML
jgi:uncharacterized protein